MTLWLSWSNIFKDPIVKKTNLVPWDGILKPFQISKTAQQEVKSSKIEFLHTIRDQLSRMEPFSSQNAPDVVGDSHQSVSVLHLDSTFYEKAFQE